MNWGDLWNFPFEADVWGTVWSGVGSVLTAGSLLLGFVILRRDQKDKRQAQSSKIVFTHSYSLDFDTDHVTSVRGKIFNHSDAIITNTAIMVKRAPDVIKQSTTWFYRFTEPIVVGLIKYHNIHADRDFTGIVGPGEMAEFVIRMPERFQANYAEIEVRLIFADANSNTWYRLKFGTPELHKYHGRVKRVAVRFLKWGYARTPNRFKTRKYASVERY